MSPKSPSNFLFKILPFFAVFLSSLFHPYDPDLGWHLKYGQYFFEHHKILKENIFSSQMPDYHWVNSSWATDLISYLVFDNFGFLGLAALGAIVITLTFYFFAKSADLNYFEKALIFPPLIYFLAPLNSVSFRGQLSSLLMLGVLMWVLTRYDKGDQLENENNVTLIKRVQLIYFLPLLFVLWSNMHGQFILGLAIFGIWIASVFLEKLIDFGLNLKLALGKVIIPLAVLVTCTLAALINPFGIGVYLEAIKHFGNPQQASIIEWTGLESLTIIWWHHVLVGFGIFFGLIYLFFSSKIKESIPQISISSIIYLISYAVRRYAWTAYYLSMPLLKPLAAYFKPDSKKYTNIAATIVLALYLAGTFLIDNPLSRIKSMSWQTYCQKYVYCSDEAISYLKNNLDPNSLDVFDLLESERPRSRRPEGLRSEWANLLTYYGWGGYLIANHPEIKPSIDGRMHLWRDKTGYSAFEEYFAYEQDTENIDNSKYDVVLMYRRKPLYKRLEKLVDEGKWQKVFEDKFAGVFVRN